MVAAPLNFVGFPSTLGSLRLPNCPCPSSSWGLARPSSMVRFGGWGGPGVPRPLELRAEYERAQHTPVRGLGGPGWGVERDRMGSHPWVLLTPPRVTPAMVELDGDDIRISSRGKVAERDIVQVPWGPHPAHPAGWWGVPWGPQIGPVTPGVPWVGRVWRGGEVDWDLGGHWDKGIQWVWDALGNGRDALGNGKDALGHGGACPGIWSCTGT